MLDQLAATAARFLQGAREGARTGARTNTRMLDALTGRVLFHNHSHADDAARLLEKRLPQGPDSRH